MRAELVIFDWDGTLIDSTTRIAECLWHAAGDMGLPQLPLARYRSIIGLGLPEALHDLYPEADETARGELRNHYARHFIAASENAPSPPYDGAVALLDTLRGHGLRLAIATGKNRPGLVRAFRDTGLGDYFEITRTADETASKPDPRMLHEILADTGVAPARAVMIGDTGFDLAMARSAGVPAIGITHGAHEIGELRRHAPLALIDHLGEVPALLRLPAPVPFTSHG